MDRPSGRLTPSPSGGGPGRGERIEYWLSRALLRKPSLYLSDFLERHRGIYYDALTRVRVSNDLAHRVKFFLAVVIETVGRGQRTFQSILALRNELGSKMVTLG